MLPTSQFFTRGNLGPSGGRVSGGLLGPGEGSRERSVFPSGCAPRGSSGHINHPRDLLLGCLLLPYVSSVSAHRHVGGRQYWCPHLQTRGPRSEKVGSLPETPWAQLVLQNPGLPVPGVARARAAQGSSGELLSSGPKEGSSSLFRAHLSSAGHGVSQPPEL